MAISIRFQSTIDPKKFNNLIYNKTKKLLKKQVLQMREELLDELSNVFSKWFIESKTIRSLLGAYAGDTEGYDLQAEFGLTPLVAERAIMAMISILGSDFNLKIESGKAATGTLIQIRLSGLYQRTIDRLKNIPEGSYISYSTAKHFGGSINGTGVVIPWLEWLLDGKKLVLEDYGIAYGSFDRARSGRAIMVSDSLIGKKKKYPQIDMSTISFPWSLPRMAIPRRGRNFIESIVLSKKFQNDLSKKIKRKFMLRLERFAK